MMIYILDGVENIVEKGENAEKTLWKKEKMLVTSIFSFSHIIFQKLLVQGCKNLLLCGKELTRYLICQFWTLQIQQQIKI